MRHINVVRKTKVNNYVKKSGVAVGAHERRLFSLEKQEDKTLKLEVSSPATLVEDQVSSFVRRVYPDPEIVEASKRTVSLKNKIFGLVLNRKLLLEVEKLSNNDFGNIPNPFQKVRYDFDSAGEGQITVGRSSISTDFEYRTLDIKPGTVVDNYFFSQNVDFGGIHAPGFKFRTSRGTFLNFNGAVLDGASFGPHVDTVEKFWNSKSHFENVSFDGASLRKARFYHSSFSGVSFRGADLEDAEFVNILNYSPVDFSDSNVTFDQLEEFAGSPWRYEKVDWSMVKYHEYSFHDAIDELGVSSGQFEFMVNSGVIKIRDNESKELVEKDFDPELHHVDQWEIQKAANQVHG